MKTLLIISFIFIVCCFSFPAVSQIINNDEPEPGNNFNQRFFTGGNLGLQFGTITFIDVSPIIGYQISKKTQAGVGVTYRYFQDNRFNYSTSIYGGRTFFRYFFMPNLFAHSEYEVLNGEWRYNERYNITSIFVGGGFAQRLGGRSFLSLMLLWNLNDSADSPYTNPVIRGGFNIGI
jgi:hypothetical protein